MPKDKIQKAIDVGTGAGSDGAAIERIVYEGYGPAGVAVLVEALTDNRNRASAEIRHAFSKHGGSLGEPGSVAWIFEKKGAIVVDGGRYGEDDLIGAIDAGAEDVREDEGEAAGDLRAGRPHRRARSARGRRHRGRVGGARDRAEKHGRGQGARRRAGAEAARRARRPGRRRRGLRQLRHPEPRSRDSWPPSAPLHGSRERWKASDRLPRITSHAGSDGDRPWCGQPRLRHRPGRGQPHGRPRRRRGRDRRPISRWSGGWSGSTAPWPS